MAVARDNHRIVTTIDKLGILVAAVVIMAAIVGLVAG